MNFNLPEPKRFNGGYTEKITKNPLIESLYNIYLLKLDVLGVKSYSYKFSMMEKLIDEVTKITFDRFSISNRNYRIPEKISYGQEFEYFIEIDISFEIFTDMCYCCIDGMIEYYSELIDGSYDLLKNEYFWLYSKISEFSI